MTICNFCKNETEDLCPICSKLTCQDHSVKIGDLKEYEIFKKIETNKRICLICFKNIMLLHKNNKNAEQKELFKCYTCEKETIFQCKKCKQPICLEHGVNFDFFKNLYGAREVTYNKIMCKACYSKMGKEILIYVAVTIIIAIVAYILILFFKLGK